MENLVKVFTGKGLQTMFEEGGTGHWKASSDRISRCKYVVCVRNIYAEWSEHDLPHSTAFVIGRNLSIIEAEDRNIIGFNEYAKINIPDAWDGNRNPVTYTDVDSLGLDLEKLDWQKFPTDQVRPEDRVKPLTIAEAKNGLAKGLGINLENIEIIIKI
jgi:hypothetical protein